MNGVLILRVLDRIFLEHLVRLRLEIVHQRLQGTLQIIFIASGEHLDDPVAVATLKQIIGVYYYHYLGFADIVKFFILCYYTSTLWLAKLYFFRLYLYYFYLA